ncbi:head maturation protease, ClpP-related [Streptomyces murinus]|uniref:head maturation protease, ClpP-related n=1 Tax=Streptomyces murinus TaxID=33900 RepID=UPI0018F6B1E3|nr:head maturation protease, ClpP-related [Streptomyces murinus]
MNITLPGKAASFMASQREQAEKRRAQLGVEAQSWYRITNAAADEAEVMLYDEVGGWFGATADQFIADLRGVTAPNLRVRINSPGGSVFEGIAIANALRSHPANVTVQVDGIAASIASVIAMAGDRIEMAPNTMLMIHDASGMCMGNAADMAEMAELLDLISDNIADAYAARAGGTRDDWRALMRNETWYLPDDAVQAGLADAAVQTPKQGDPTEPDETEAEPDMARAFDLAAFGYTGPRAEQPKAETGLTEDIRSLIGEEIAAQLRAAVQPEPANTPVPQVVDKALPVHHTDTVDEPWDGPAAVKAMPNDDAVLRYCFAWQSDDAAREPHEEGDDDADDQKANYKFPHHKTKGGPANLAACRDGLARLGNSSIPEGDKAGVRKHLQAHLDDAKQADNTADGWTVLTAHLTQDDADDWSASVSHLTDTTASPSAAEA